jgi:hypothetical protein
MFEINYTAEPTLAQFHACDAPVRGIMGPIGSGKSVGCCIEIISRAARQAPDSTGVRRTRWAAIRNSYPELKSTTIKTWQEWAPSTICPITFGAPIEGWMRWGLPDGTMAELNILFLALDRPDDVKKLLSLELTGVWVNEAREMDRSIVQAAFSRTGRYPAKRVAETTWSGLIMDTNPPDTDHWWYVQAEQKKPEDWKFFRQPGVRDDTGRVVEYLANPKAENVRNQPLGFTYWSRQVSGADPEWVRVHCCGEYGSVFAGKGVYQGIFNEFIHVARTPLGIYKGMPLCCGFDFGLTPAFVLGQVTPSGQLRILRELVCERGGIKQFVSDAVKPMLNMYFAGMPMVSTGDPAGAQGSQADEMTCLRQLELLGIPTRPAPTNEFLARRQAVIDRLTRMIDGKPALVIDKSCEMVIKGFMGGYMFERVQVTGEERYKDVPSKNRFSHPAEALQYLVLGVDTVPMARGKVAPPAPANPWGGMV